MNNWKLRHSFTGNATSDVQTVNGYLADPAYHLTTNFLLYSNQFDSWIVSGGTTVTSGQTGYDGSSDAYQITKDASGFRFVRQGLTSPTGVVTFSVYMKAGTLTTATLRLLSSPDARAKFDLNTGAEISSQNVLGTSSTNMGGGWWRYSMTAEMTTMAEQVIYPDDIAATNAGYIYIQDAQLEEGTQATTYVETTTEPVTLPDTFNVTVVPDGKEYAAPLFIPRTNLLLQSNQFDTDWFNYNSTESAGESGYDGGSDAWLLSKTGASGLLQQYIDADGLQTYSIYAKAGSLSFLMLRYKNTSGQYYGTYFDLANGQVETETAQIIESKITTVGGGWYRCSITFNQALEIVFAYPADSDGGIGNAVTGDIYIQDAQLQTGSVATEYIPTNGSQVTRDWSAFGRVQNQVPGICNGTHTHTGAASGSGIAATTITGSGSGATFAYDFDTLGVLTTLTADGAGSGYKVGDKLSIDTTEGHTIEFRLVEGSNAATVSVSMGAAKPNKPIPFPVSKMRVEGLTDRTVLFMDERSRYVFPKPTPYLLDTYEGAAAAYSLRRLRSSYTGPAVRVRRNSNNDELDIYFNGDGSLDTATLEAFCAGTDGFVKVWYDQGQGGNDAEQTSTASQPQIVSSGSVVTENGLPAVEFDGANDHLQNSSVPTGTIFTADAENTIVAVMYQDGAKTDNVLLSNNSTTDIFTVWATQGTSNNLIYDVGNSGNNRLLYSYGGATTFEDVQNLLFWSSSATLQQICVNGTQLASGTAPDTITLSSTILRIGSRYSTYFMGSIQELIVYPSDESSNRTGIETNINEHYGIYEFSGLLDDYSGAAAAYSLRRLSSTYTGPAIRVVKHDVGYPEMDIPFEDDGTLSVVLLEAFADGYDATVKVWYDQSGGSNDAEQSTLASQPKIVDAGTVIYENGLPALEFDGASNYMKSQDYIVELSQNPASVFSVSQTSTLSNSNYLLSEGDNVSPYSSQFILGGGGSVGGTDILWVNGTTLGTMTTGQVLTGFDWDQTNATAFIDGSQSGISKVVTVNTEASLYSYIGSRADGTTNFFTGKIQELITYKSDQSSNREGIEDNINEHYGIYP